LIALLFLVIPLIALILQTPWEAFPKIISSPQALEALRLSFVVSLAATALAAIFGIPMAWLLAREVLPFT
ncbi:MAG TPA: molybdate ABC transporter permease subunit, partial [Candidatus Aquiluna sp.]|nr:molybdate ABC transporter permease subunit [Aquiluna sp.]